MHVVAIIPARGGSKGIPRKNTRLLGGVPLIAHAIRTCLASRRVSRTVVSTEDEEIAVVARRFGAEVLVRPAALAGDEVPLAPVVHHVVTTLEEGGPAIDVVATVQPTSPLIRAASLDRGLACFEDAGVDTVLTVRDNTHLHWRLDGEGRPAPLYVERVNRQHLARTLTETGGLIASRRSVVTADERIGTNIRLLELDDHEAVDIDGYADWWLAEKLLNRKRVVFHVLGSRGTGLGHVHRVMTLARRMTDHETVFLTSMHDDLAARILEEGHLPVHRHDGDPLPALEALAPDVVVNDVLDTEAATVEAMRARGWRVVNFEDHGAGAAHAHAVINALYHDPDPPPHAHVGPGFYCLREEFFTARRRDVQPTVETVAVCFGGTDPGALTVKVVRAIGTLPATFRLVVIVGPGFDADAELSAALAAIPHGHEVVRDTRAISAYMERADVMVTSAGRTVYEAATIGVPTLVLCQNEREQRHAFAAEEHGFENLGLGADVPPEELARRLRALIEDPARRREMQHRMWAWDGRAGIDRVLRIVLGEDA